MGDVSWGSCHGCMLVYMPDHVISPVAYKRDLGPNTSAKLRDTESFYDAAT